MRLTKNIYSKVIVNLPVIILISLLLAITVCGYYYFKGELSAHLTPLLGGLFSGLILVVLQFLFNWYEYSAMSKFHALKIKNILLHRDDRNFYQNLIGNAVNQIDVLGVTAARFMEHFADDTDNSRPDSKVLLTALAKGVKVRILIPSKEYLKFDDDKTKAVMAERLLKKTAEKYDNFTYLYFNHEPVQSIVVIDDECLIGPVLPPLPSRHTPAIYVSNDSPYAKKYLEYFDREWQEAELEKK
jgi:hypothetical protein